MQGVDLKGCEVLLVEDEPLVMMDVCEALEDIGARVHCAKNTAEAAELMSQKRIQAAVLDYKLNGETADELCHDLKRKEIPFAIYSGYRDVDGDCAHGEIIEKPARAEELVALVLRMLSEKGLYVPA